MEGRRPEGKPRRPTSGAGAERPVKSSRSGARRKNHQKKRKPKLIRIMFATAERRGKNKVV